MKMKSIIFISLMILICSCQKERIVKEDIIIQNQINAFHKKTAHIRIIGGQSNAVGQGLFSDLPVSLQGKLRNCFVYNPVSDNIDTLQASVNNEGEQVGIELNYMHTIDSLTHYSNGDINVLVKYAVDGTAIHQDSTKLDWNVNSTNELYFNMVSKILRAKEVLQLQGYNVVIENIIWYQGESDTDFGGWYQNAFDLFTQLRKDIRNNNLEVCIVRIHRKFDIYQPLFDAVRADQERLCQLPRYTMLDIDNHYPARVHLFTSSYDSIGYEAAILMNKF